MTRNLLFAIPALSLTTIWLSSVTSAEPDSMGLAVVPPAVVREAAVAARGPEARSGEEMMPLRIGHTEVMNQLTGAASPNQTARRWNVHGTDLGHMFFHRGKLHMVFGDTFGPGGVGGRNWRSNVMARIADPVPRNGLPFESMITGPHGAAKELVSSRKVDHDEMTVIPTQGISINGRMYLHYMSVRHWGQPGHWTVGHSGFAYSDDDGRTWEKPAGAVWEPNSGFEQVAFASGGAADEEMLYTLGIPEGRFGGVRLRRVARPRILDKDAYSYWDGSEWVVDPAAAAEIVPGPVGELSVAWSQAHRRWLMMYLETERHAIVLRSAPKLTGPWSDARTVVTAKEYPGLYAPYIVPGSEIDDTLYYTMSQWGPYNVFLMRTALGQAPSVASTGTKARGAAARPPGRRPARQPDKRR